MIISHGDLLLSLYSVWPAIAAITTSVAATAVVTTAVAPHVIVSAVTAVAAETTVAVAEDKMEMKNSYTLHKTTGV